MFKNEVIVEKKDKDELVALMARAKEILDRYPYNNGVHAHTVTTISRAKGFVNDAKEWCGYLHTEAE